MSWDPMHGNPDCKVCLGTGKVPLDVNGTFGSTPIWGEGPCYYCMANEQPDEDAIQWAADLRKTVEEDREEFSRALGSLW